MLGAKNIVVKLINAQTARPFIMKHHYSGKIVQNSKLHFGCFLNGVLGGVMSFGSPMDKSKTLPLFNGDIAWNGVMELNRMAFSDILPKNSESRCIAYALRFIKQHYPFVKAIISFADGAQCGDGTIYRATGFSLTQIKRNRQIIELPNGERVARITINVRDGTKTKDFMDRTGGKFIDGYMLRYVKILDPSITLNCDVLPYSTIDDMNAGMYLGEKRMRVKHSDDATTFHVVEGGLKPTDAHQFEMKGAVA